VAKAFDVVIIGGGVMGSSTAYHLLAGGLRQRVAVIEKDPVYERASTTLSVGGVRRQFTTPANIELALYGIDFYQRFGAVMAVDGEAPDVSFRRRGYLFLAESHQWPAYERRQALWRRMGVEVHLLGPHDVARLLPGADLTGVVGGSFSPGDGFVDPYSVMQGFARKARSLGARYVHDEVTAVLTGGGAVRGVATRSGEEYAAPVVVNAAGPWAGEVACMAGVDLPVRPVRHQVFAVKCDWPGDAVIPMVIDSAGEYFRQETGGLLVTGRTNEAEPEGVNFQVDREYFVNEVWTRLAARVPALERLRLERGWAGLYEINRLDNNAVIGAHPGLVGFCFINGFSGHGLMQGPGAGLALAEIIHWGRPKTIDVRPLGYERILAGRPVLEEAFI